MLVIATELTLFLTLKGIGHEALTLEAQQHCCDDWTKEVMKNADAGHTHTSSPTPTLWSLLYILHFSTTYTHPQLQFFAGNRGTSLGTPFVKYFAGYTH